MLGASVHTTLLTQECHRRPVSVSGGILSLLLSVCRMQSAFQWSSPETPTCGILISHLSRSRLCDVPIIPFLDLLMASCRLELCNPPDRATHTSGAGLDCIFISSGHVVDVVVNDGLQCCTGSPVCCPVLGSDHFLCIAAGLSPPTRPDPVRGPTLPPLRDWRPTLIRAHEELFQWSARVQDLCQSSPPSRRQLLGGVFNEMIAILHHHAPAQRCHRRRRQPSWWTPECHQACVARNGAGRDHRQVPSAATRERFRNARTSFHRVVRRCQNQFWSDWQENLTSLSRVNPRAAASRVREMFSGQSRRDHTHLVRWPQFSSSEPSRTDIVEQWRQHFVSVGSQSSGVFDEDFHDEVTRRFSALCAGPHDTGGQFDGPFSVAELVGALSRCAESAVGGDGLPYSLFKVALPWWRSALLNRFNLCLSWNDVPTMWKHSVIVPVFKTGDHSVLGNYRPISLASCCFKVLEHMVHSRIAPCISPQLHHCQGGSRWGADMMAGSLIDVLHMRSATHTFVAFVDIFKAFDTCWVEATMVELFSIGGP